MSDPLPPDLADAFAAARARIGSAALRYFREVDSTNDVALALAGAGAPEGTAVCADLQRTGRGRRGRAWLSPPGAGVYLSCVVRADPISNLGLLTLAAGVAAAQTVTSISGLPVELKWPNDMVVGRPWRKLGGILCETAGVGARVDAVVVGIGINLRSAAYPAELRDRATSIETELGRPVDRAPLVVECLARVIEIARELRDGQPDAIVAAWRELAASGLNGAPVRWQDQLVERSGRARGVDADGALLVEIGGRIERIIAGEVTWDRPT